MSASAGNSRRAAAFAVAKWLATGAFAADVLPASGDRAFIQSVVYMVVRRRRALRWVLDSLVSRWPKGELEALLYVGAAQVLYMPEVPDFAAVNETVDAAKACGNPSVTRMVNGVLRNLVRRREELLARLASEPLAVRESFPDELVARWTARFGPAAAERLCAWHNTPAETFLARRDGSFTRLERGVSVASVPGYAEGEFLVQDPGTALAVALLAPAAGERVLDACAAPGGKTAQVAWRGAQVTACEVNPRRRRRLQENLARLRLEVPVLEALPTEGTFGKVLVDAPCSNTGVLRRRPDARWNWSSVHLSEVTALQAEILDRVAPRVAPGGTLVYATCSNEPEENGRQVSEFLARHPEFALREQRESVPVESGTDGAFAAALVRRADGFMV